MSPTEWPCPRPLPPAELVSVEWMIVHYDSDNSRNASTELGSVEWPISHCESSFSSPIGHSLRAIVPSTETSSEEGCTARSAS